MLTAAFVVRAADRPNILVILSDDQGYADVSINPHSPKGVHTPNIDALARSGAIMTNGYTTGHVCAPTRLGMMTARYQQRYGTYSAGQCGSGIAPQHKLVVSYMQEQGYATGAFGKWHMGIGEEHNPSLRGFDAFYGFMGRGARDYFDLKQTSEAQHSTPLMRNLETIDDEGYLTTRITEEAIAFIEKSKEKPWFCYVPYNAVHAPAQAPDADVKRYSTGDPQRDILLAMLYHLDKGVGDLLATLKKHNIYENTLVFYLSDNGGAGSMKANNAPFRAFKQSDYEGGVHVPFYVSWPKVIKPGTVCDVPVSSMDVLTTACAAGDVNIPAGHGADGVDMLPAIQGKTAKLRDYFCWNDSAGKWAVRAHDGWKLVGVKGQVELFNLNDDVGESKNLIDKHPERAAQLRKAYDGWLDQMATPVSGYKRWTPEVEAAAKNKKANKAKKKKGAKQ
jgi:arylsulfatase A-like enzyme